MAKCVNTRCGGDTRRRSHCKGRVDNCQCGNNRRSAEEHFDVVFSVGNDCVLGDFGACARSRRNGNEIRHGHINDFVHVGINLPVARRRHETDSLRGIHGAAAAECNDKVATVFLVDLQARVDDFVGRFGVRAVEDDVRNVDFLQSRFDFRRVAEFDHELIRHDKSFGALARNVITQLRNDIDAGNDLSRHHESVAHKIHSPKVMF